MDIDDRIREQLGSHRVVLYMKGTPDFPMCGFSGRVVQLLQASKADFGYVNILEDPELRERLKTYANWPTYPQLYVEGELVGGCDIISEMYQSGELQPLLQGEGAAPA